MEKKNFYITTTLPYVNAPLHLGHATEIIRADAIARYQKLRGREVFFNTGTDEHGMKIFNAASANGQTPQEYTDYYANLYRETLQKFGVTEDAHYIRTTDAHHVAAAQAFWKKCADNGYIYKKNYQAKYCVGCEEEKKDSDLVDGKCPVHPNLTLELIDEENYFFKFSEFGDKLLKYFDEHPDFVVPDFRLNEAREFVKRGLNDFSISRLKSKLSWGVPVPGDDDHVMYVWFDALVNYISTLGWPDAPENFDKFWNGADSQTVQYCGKDNTRFQAVMWQAMLMAAEIKNTNKIVVDGFILGVGGVKMSKSLGNVIDPLDIVNEYGTDALRYFILREFNPFEDTPVSTQSLKEAYNANLANGLGNLVSRVMKMAGDNIDVIPADQFDSKLPDEFCAHMDSFNIQKAADFVWQKIAEADKIIQDKEPFKLIKTDRPAAQEILTDLVKRVAQIALMLEPLLPETSLKVITAVMANTKPKNLFGRRD